MSGLVRQGVRFVGLGGLNTLITGALLAGLARVMDPRLAYTLVYALGVVLASTLTGRIVFSVRATRRQRMAFAGWYLATYLIGLAVVQILSSRNVSPTALAIVTVCITAPLGFLGGRLIFGVGAENPDMTGRS